MACLSEERPWTLQEILQMPWVKILIFWALILALWPFLTSALCKLLCSMFNKAYRPDVITLFLLLVFGTILILILGNRRPCRCPPRPPGVPCPPGCRCCYCCQPVCFWAGARGGCPRLVKFFARKPCDGADGDTGADCAPTRPKCKAKPKKSHRCSKCGRKH